MNSTILDNILETSMVNGVEQNLKDALTDVGVNVPENACLWDVSNLIRKTLVSNTINGVNIKGAGAIKIVPTVDNDNITYTISVNVDTFRLKRPGYANNNEKFGNDLDVQDLFDDLFDNILPNVKGIHAGDITMTDNKGDDSTYWVNTYFESTGKKTGLIPNTKYLRLYLTSQDEPLYISMGSDYGGIMGGYNIKNSDTVSFSVNEDTKEISAHISVINISDIEKLYKY